MNYAEYQSVKSYSYEQYCEYLTNKYEQTSKVGLFKHHTFENVKANLSNPIVQSTATEEERNTITYCDFLEHLFLHILIGEQTDARKALGLGGAINYIIPQLNKYFDNNEFVYGQEYYQNIDKCTFDILVQRCEEATSATQIALEHNVSVYLQAEKYLEEKGKALVVIGTGLGKTTTALEYLWKHKCRALVIGPNNLIKSGWEEYSDWCDTTTYQTFANNYSQIDYSQYGIVILDEAHHVGYDEDTDKGAAVWNKGIKYIIDNGIKVLGLTATPERSDKINIGSTIFEGCVCEGFAVEDGIEKGIIHPFSYVTAYYDTNGIAEEYSDCENKELVGQLDLAINNTPTVKDIFRKHMPNNKRKGIVFIQEIADEQNVVDIMKDVYPDVEMRIIHSKMPQKEVEANRKWFEETDEGYLLAVNMISEGAHYNGVNTIIMFRRTSSYLVFTQQLGRIITLTKNQDPHAIVFDLVNNIENIEYDNISKDIKEKHEICKIANRLKETEAFKSGQIIVADETRNIVECIKEIKEVENQHWSKEELEILREYYAQEGRLIKERLNRRNWRSIAAKAYSLGLKMSAEAMLCKPWPENDVVLLREKYPLYGRNITELIDIGYTTEQIAQKAKREKIVYKDKMSWAVWSKEEDEFLRFIFEDKEGKREEVVKIFRNKYPYRTDASVKARMKTLRLSKIENIKFWLKEEDEIIKKYYSSLGTECVSMLPSRTKESIKSRAKALGVFLTKPAANAKRVICLESNQIFASASEAMNVLKIQGVDNVCRGKGCICNGCHWAYLDDFRKSHVSNEEYIIKIEERRKKHPRRQIKCLETGQIFKSLKEAMEITKITSIPRGIRNNVMAGGYHWEYVEENDNV